MTLFEKDLPYRIEETHDLTVWLVGKGVRVCLPFDALCLLPPFPPHQKQNNMMSNQEKKDSNGIALLLIDVQNDFIDGSREFRLTQDSLTSSSSLPFLSLSLFSRFPYCSRSKRCNLDSSKRTFSPLSSTLANDRCLTGFSSSWTHLFRFHS